MGIKMGHAALVNMPMVHRLGWYDDGEIVYITKGVHTLNFVDNLQSTTGVRALVYQDPYYPVDKVHGATLLYYSILNNKLQIHKMRPYSTRSQHSARLHTEDIQTGKRFTDTNTGITFEVLSLGTSSAQVDVSFSTANIKGPTDFPHIHFGQKIKTKGSSSKAATATLSFRQGNRKNANNMLTEWIDDMIVVKDPNGKEYSKERIHKRKDRNAKMYAFFPKMPKLATTNIVVTDHKKRSHPSSGTKVSGWSYSYRGMPFEPIEVLFK
jgi:hypothetical protein